MTENNQVVENCYDIDGMKLLNNFASVPRIPFSKVFLNKAWAKSTKVCLNRIKDFIWSSENLTHGCFHSHFIALEENILWKLCLGKLCDTALGIISKFVSVIFNRMRQSNRWWLVWRTNQIVWVTINSGSTIIA